MSRTHSPDKAQLLGVTVHGPAPLGLIHVSFADPVAAIYGKNGAGKSLTIEAVRATLQGVVLEGGVGYVHFRLARTDEPDLEQRLATALQERILKRSQEVYRTERELAENYPGEPGLFSELLANFAPLQEAELETDPYEFLVERFLKIEALLDGKYPDSLPDSLANINRELMDSPFVSLRALGSAGAPRWSAALGATKTSTGYWNDVEKSAKVRRKIADFQRLGRPADVGELVKDVAAHLPNLRSLTETPPALGAGVSQWPDWAPFPCLEYGEITSIPVDVLLPQAPLESVSEGMRAYLGGTSQAEEMEHRACQVANRATEIFQRCLDTTRSLHFAVNDPAAWLIRGLPRWTLQAPGGELVPLELASAAEKAWAVISISLTLHAQSQEARRSVLLIDEPERGLHSSQVADLPHTLSELAGYSGSSVLVATHAPSMLNHHAVSPIFVRMEEGTTQLRPIPSGTDELDADWMRVDLGLSRSDALAATRVFVLVEGLHDEIVLRGLLRRELESARAHIIPLRGAKGLRTVAEAKYLFEYTDATFVIVLDNLPVEELENIFLAAQAAYGIDDTRAALAELEPLRRSHSGESKWVSELMIDAIKSALTSRIAFATLPQPDIVVYLPLDAFASDAPDAPRDWRTIIEEWRASDGRDLKKWMTQRYGFVFDEGLIRAATEEAVPHGDIRDVGERILRFARPRGPQTTQESS